MYKKDKYYWYRQICESGSCIIRRKINAHIDDKQYVLTTVAQDCKTCGLRYIMLRKIGDNA